MAAAYPLASRPPYFLSWLNPQISAQNMMHPEMFEKLVLNNFGKYIISPLVSNASADTSCKN